MRLPWSEKAIMVQAKFEVTCQWDPEAGLWFVAESNVPGLSAEAPTKEAMVGLLDTLIPQLVELNCPEERKPSDNVPWELLFGGKQPLTARR
jgi:hypothetical protein